MNKDKLSEKRLRKVIEEHIDKNVKVPAFQTIEKDFYAQDKLASLLVLLQVTIDCIQKEGLDFDKDFLRELPESEIEGRIEVLDEFIETGYLSQETIVILKSDSSRKYLLAYLGRELNWVAISILSGSYISAHIIMRSIFELLIGITTKKTGSMKERIDSILFLSSQEREDIKKLWRGLCGWAHPFGKWIKEVCPIFVSQGPMYHSELCKKCLEELEILIDLLLVVSLEKFEISRKEILDKVDNYRIDTSNLTLFRNRC